MPQEPSDKERLGFDLFERTQHTGEISSKPYEATSGFALHAIIGGAYRVIEFIGEGGMGLVYKVEHIAMNKIMALKVLKTEHLSENVWKRFRLEAQAISRLDHANIIKIYDMNQTEDGRPFYTMELLSGQSLADYLEQNERLPVGEALPIFRQVCAALAYAHERGIIHRDIKPGNIMLLSEAGAGVSSRVKIVDFGIVKLVDGDQVGQGLTKQGEVFGSPLYMSPEQCAGSKLDARADMYSVGVTLFQALAGKPPLVGRTASETTIMHHTTVPPRLSEVAGIDFSDELEAVVAKMLAKDPEDRYRSLSDVARVLLSIERNYSGAPLTAAATKQPSLKANEPLFDTAFDHGLNSETGESTASSESRNLKPLLVLTGVVAALALVVIVFFGAKLLSGQTKPKEPPRSTGSFMEHPELEESATERFARSNILEVTSSPETDKIIALFLKQRKEPFFKIDKDGVTKFSFPREISIGTVETIGRGVQSQHDAQGEFEWRSSAGISFSANEITLAHPELLHFFPAIGLYSLKFIGEKPGFPAPIKEIMRQRNLGNLDLTGIPLNVRDFKAIASLKRLTSLMIDSSNLSHKDLLESKLLGRLECVGLIRLNNCAPVLETLLSSKNLRSLTLTCAKLKKSDFATIAKMTSLNSLSLGGTNLSDSDLKQFANLQHLESVSFTGTSLTIGCIPTLKKIKGLRQVYLPPDVETAYWDSVNSAPK